MASPPCGRRMGPLGGQLCSEPAAPMAPLKGTGCSAGLKGTLTHTLLGSGLGLQSQLLSLPPGLLLRPTPQPGLQASLRGRVPAAPGPRVLFGQVAVGHEEEEGRQPGNTSSSRHRLGQSCNITKTGTVPACRELHPAVWGSLGVGC